jgi:hypothetical protein
MAAVSSVERMTCPGCGREVAAVATRCLYCRANLERPKSIPPGAEDEGDATRCALCGRYYLTSKHASCPHCAGAFADPIRRAEVEDRRRHFATRLTIRTLVAALAAGLGLAASRALAHALPTFGSLRTPALLAAAVTAALFAWRAHDRAKLRRDPTLLDTGVMFMAVFGGIAPWCIAVALWTNGFGLDAPAISVACNVQQVDVDPPDASVHLQCRLDDGSVLRTVVTSEATTIAPGAKLVQPLQRGRLGLYVTERELVLAE